MGFRDGAEVGFCIGMQFCERCEVGRAEEQFACFVHQLEVELLREVVCKGFERTLLCYYIIMICTRGGTEPCMHVGSNRLDGMYSYVCRQKFVQFVAQLCQVVGREWRVVVEMCHHARCVDPSVCPSGTYNFELGAQEGGECLLERLLYGGCIRLYLPTVVCRSVV